MFRIRLLPGCSGTPQVALGWPPIKRADELSRKGRPREWTRVCPKYVVDDGKERWMSHGNQDPFRLGFLTAVEDAERGFVGGLLVTNRFGRPLEFQCTAPVKPNRAQQILYGPTLRPYVLGELLGRTLIDKIGVKPHLVLLDTDEILDLRQHVSMVVGFVQDAKPDDPLRLSLGMHAISFHPEYATDRAEIARHAPSIPAEANLREPFERVREALAETLRMGTARTA